MNIQIADRFMKCRRDIRRVPEQEAGGAERRRVARLTDQQSEMGATACSRTGVQQAPRQAEGNRVVRLSEEFFGKVEFFQQRAGGDTQIAQDFGNRGERRYADFSLFGQRKFAEFCIVHPGMSAGCQCVVDYQ